MNKLLSILLLFACSYDGLGVTDTPKTNSSSSSTTLISTSEIEITTNLTTTGNQTTLIESSSSLNPTTEINITSTTEINTNTTEISTTSITGDDSTTLELTTGFIERCGDCIMQENEECDWCIYEYIPGLSMCKEKDEGKPIKPCWIELGPTTLWAGKPLEGMITPEYDKEEADLLCQIVTRMQNVEAINYEINQGTNEFYNIILPENVNGLGYLLKTIDNIYNNQKLYYFNNKDIPMGFEMESFLYADSCKII